MKIAIIGGGAAGCFAAIETARLLPRADIHIYESLKRPLVKVGLTGGGRCNLTNSFRHVTSAEQVYPRGARLMKRLLKEFGPADTMAWFEREGVELVTQTDECVFPATQKASTIVDTLTRLLAALHVKLHCARRVKAIVATEAGYRLSMADGGDVEAQAVVVTTGGYPREASMSLFRPLALKTVPPVPSLFSFTLADDRLKALSGTVVEQVTARLTTTKFKATGALLITHMGLSGPAILKLSAYAARHLHDSGYRATLSINWWGEATEDDILATLRSHAATRSARQTGTTTPSHLCRRLWHYLLDAAHIAPHRRWSELQPKELRRLAALLSNHQLSLTGRNPYKEEFVTCGGIALSEIVPSTLESRAHRHLYFAGEALDVDAVTGGFNLQAAWSMGYVVARSLSRALADANDNAANANEACPMD